MQPLITERDQRALMTPSTLTPSCWTGTSSGSFARKRKTSGGPSFLSSTGLATSGGFRPRHQSQALLVSLRKLGGNRSSSPPNILIAFEGKPHSSSKAIAQAFNRQFTACFVQYDRAYKRFMRDLHNHHHVNLSYRPFYERGVAAAIRKAGSSTPLEGVVGFHSRRSGCSWPHDKIVSAS